MKKHLFIFIMLLCLFSCSNDEFGVSEQMQNPVSKNLKVQYKRGNDVSISAINFIKNRTNNTFTVSTKKGSIKLNNSQSFLKNDELGTVDTSKEIVVVNETNTKHTFKVITPNESLHTITNLVIVEKAEGSYEYFLKYTFSGEFPINEETGAIDISKFNGTIETFNASGNLIGSITIENGTITSDQGQLSPCPDDNQEPNDNGDTNTGSSSSGSDSSTGIPNDNTNEDPVNVGNGDPDSSAQYTDSNGDCGLTFSYERCGCGGDANGHPPQGVECCQGSPLIIRDCNGNILAQRNSDVSTTMFKRNVFDPCNDGDTGVILNSITDIEGMDDELINWLVENPDIRIELEVLYNQEINNPFVDSFILELIRMLKDEVNVELKVIKFIIAAFRSDKIDNDLDTDFLTTVLPQLDISVNDGSDYSIGNHDLIINYFTIKCAVLRYNHPDWSDIRIYYETSKEVLHITLDVFGLVPIIGEVADLTNGVLYTIEGDGVNASLSYASAIPLVGWATAGTKMGLKVVNAASDMNTRVKLVWKITNEGIIQFGRRSQLRKVLGLAVGDARQAHHLIPWANRSHEVVQLASKSGSAFHMNEALNGIAVAAWRNQPNHNIYNARVRNKLDEILSTNPNVDEAYQKVYELVEQIRSAIINNPNTHFNDLIF
ncbi:AHH domain-containing protein [Kordia algicida OT-1]|uniref:AHH domain-containing protein n=1 Tax=Kordia algicida TaxID=221066 RepID=UPI003D9BFBA0